jgi:hypothetical protein
VKLKTLTHSLLLTGAAFLVQPAHAADLSDPVPLIKEINARLRESGKILNGYEGKTEDGEACTIMLILDNANHSLMAGVSLMHADDENSPQILFGDTEDIHVDSFTTDANSVSLAFSEHDGGGVSHTDWGWGFPRAPSTSHWALNIEFNKDKSIASVEAKAPKNQSLKCEIGQR